MKRRFRVAPADQIAWLLMAIGCAVGVFLRVYQLRGQMLIDDEWHAVRMLMRADAAGIATHFGLADYCIPLTLYYRWLFDHAMLSEWQMHLPLLLAGVATLFAAPYLMRAVVPLPTRAIWIGLLAISPSLIYFSRTARPYALIALLGPIAILAFRNWRRDPAGGRGWIPLYVFATVTAAWLHLLSMVFTLWPFAYYGIAALKACYGPATRAAGLRTLAWLVALGVGVVFLLALVLAPPLLNDWAAMSAKANAASVTTQSVYRTVLMQLGVADMWLCGALTILLLCGVARLWRRDRDLASLLISAYLSGIAVICLARPAWIQHAPVLVRYAAPMLPFVLLFIAEGAMAVGERIARPPLAALVAGMALIGVFIAGPVPAWSYWPNQFSDHALFQFDYSPQHNPYTTELQLGPIPEFYRQLAQRAPGSVTLIEAPRRAESNFMPDPWYQQVHRQNVKYAVVGSVCGAGEWNIVDSLHGMPFRRVVDLANVLDGAHHGGDYLVMNLAPWTLPPGSAFPWQVHWPDMAACVGKVVARLGAPVFSDDQIVVFALSEPSPLPPSMIRAPR